MLRFCAVICLLTTGLLPLKASAKSDLTVSLAPATQGKPSRIEIRGLDDGALAACENRKKRDDEEWQRLACVQVVRGTTADTVAQPAMLGHWFVAKGVLCFEPRFPPPSGIPLRVTIDAPKMRDRNQSEPQTFDIQTPTADLTPITKVLHIYPTRNTLPENQLRFYIHFSGPMQRGEAYANIKLLDKAGKPINDVFLELGEELWNADMTRFTLLFDPGRVKQGLKPREDLGPTLEAGKSYTLVVASGWRDGEGRRLVGDEFRKEFTAGPADNEPIDPKKWKLIPPNSGSRAAFRVKFPEPLDHALLNRVVWIVDEQGNRVDGAISIAEEETLWQFTPEKPWRSGRYRLVADTILEDLAANRIGRAFEVDVFRPIEKKVETKTVEIEFAIKPPTP